MSADLHTATGGLSRMEAGLSELVGAAQRIERGQTKGAERLAAVADMQKALGETTDELAAATSHLMSEVQAACTEQRAGLTMLREALAAARQRKAPEAAPAPVVAAAQQCTPAEDKRAAKAARRAAVATGGSDLSAALAGAVDAEMAEAEKENAGIHNPLYSEGPTAGTGAAAPDEAASSD